MAHDVFISHSDQDKQAADAVCHALEAEGLRCWIAPRDAAPGHHYQGSIVRAIRECDVMVLVFSSHANASGYVLREVSIASDEGKPVIPFRIEAEAMSDDLYFLIGSVHWLDALTPPLSQHIQRLVEATRLLLSSEPAALKEIRDRGAPAHEQSGEQAHTEGDSVEPEHRPDSVAPAPPATNVFHQAHVPRRWRAVAASVATVGLILFGLLGGVRDEGDVAGVGSRDFDREVSWLHREEAALELNKGNVDRAIELADSIIASDSEFAEAYVLRAEALRAKAAGIDDPAERGDVIADLAETYGSARQKGPGVAEDIALIVVRAWANEMKQGNRAFRRVTGNPGAHREAREAIDAFENATTLLPDSASSHLNLALVLLARGHTYDAALTFEAAIESGTDNPKAYVYLGRIYLQKDKGYDALRVLKQGQAAFPDNEEIQTEILNAYVRAGQTDRAIEAYTTRITAEPENALYRYNYGSLLLQAERYEDAAEQLTVATELDDQNANAFYNLGAAYQNKAASLNERIAQLDEANASPSTIDVLVNERASLLRKTVPNLERARALTEAAGEDSGVICRALFQVYGALRRTAEAEEAGECAGRSAR